MSWFSAYKEYIKDNPEGYWFKAKLYGWGWNPATWQGWLLMAVFLAFVIWQALVFGTAMESEPSTTEIRNYLIRIGVAVLVLIGICYGTGEKPLWNWGLPKKKNEERTY